MQHRPPSSRPEFRQLILEPQASIRAKCQRHQDRHAGQRGWNERRENHLGGILPFPSLLSIPVRVCKHGRLAANEHVTSLRFLPGAALFLLCCAATAATPKAACTFDENGLVTLSYGDAQFIKSSLPRIDAVYFADDKGAGVAADRSNPTVSYERTAQRLSYSWPWGAVRCQYQLADSRLNIILSVENDTAGPLSGIDLDLLELRFPRRPAGSSWEKRSQTLSDNDGDITALVADYQTGVLTFCNDDPLGAVRAGFAPGANPPQETWRLRVTSPEKSGDHQKDFVPPRSAKTFHFSLRFSEPGVPLKVVAGDIIEKFAADHPFQLKWADRRPIGMLVLANSGHASPTNPRGWFNEPAEKMLEMADHTIAILKGMGAQGMIFWDMEGDEFPNISFIGDPRLTAQFAPEMDAVAPEFFARFHQAGLRTGVCIRPSRIVPGWDGKSKWQHSHMGFDVVEEMNQKIIYAKKRLGCLLFYVDTNVRFFYKADGSVDSRLLEGAAFKHLADAHPDVLIIPEIPRLDYWSCTAPYQELRANLFGNHAATDPRVLDFYPRAFSVINPIDGPVQQRRGEIVAGQRRGDTLLFRCWFQDPQNTELKSILKEADGK
jgi:hypothetical protein